MMIDSEMYMKILNKISFDLIDLWPTHIKAGKERVIEAMQARLDEEIKMMKMEDGLPIEIMTAHLDKGSLMVKVRVLTMPSLRAIECELKITDSNDD